MAVVGSLSAVLPGYFGSLGARAFLRPRPNTSTRHWEAEFEGFKRREISVEGHCVPFWVKGDGPLVLLVHGWERDHFAMGGFVAPLLDAGYRVAALDLPGHGEVEGGSAPLPLLAKSIAAVASVLDQPCAVVAHSIGAAMTVLAMEAYGLKPDCAVLICAPRTAKDYALAQARRQGLGRRALRQMVEQITEALGEPLERYRVDRALASLAMPILLVHAEDDAIVPLADARENLQASSARSLWLPCGGHNRILGDSRMIDVVLEWMNWPVQEPAGAGLPRN
jgi:pimeloyl-ACP methyl ester carboxylesterase